MESLSGINHPSYLLNLSLHYRPSFTKPISSFSLKTTSSRTTQSILRASASSSSSVPPALNLKTQKEKPLLETPKPISFLVKCTCVAIFTAALVLARFNQPSIAASIVKPTVNSVDTTENEETKVKAKKYKEAISVELNDDIAVLRDYDLAKLAFEQVLEKDPISVEAYSGLMMLASSRAEIVDKMDIEGNFTNIAFKIDEELVKRIESAIEICKKNEDVREFKLLVVDIKIFEGKYTDALKINQELMNEAPEDSMVYFNQWYIYTLLGEEGEADIQFEKYRKLLPKELQEHACVYKETMLAGLKDVSQMVEILEENKTVGSKR